MNFANPLTPFVNVKLILYICVVNMVTGVIGSYVPWLDCSAS